MFISIIQTALKNLIFFALHVDNMNVFPKPLSRKQEEEAFAKMSQGDTSARTTLIEHNLRLVAHIIKKYYSNFSEQEELISIGTIGLIKAVSTFDYNKNIRLATYASKCIENEILMYFRSQKKNSSEMFIDEPIEIDKDGNQLTHCCCI